MDNKEKIQSVSIVMNGITINGPMFDIHDNGTVNNYFTASSEEKRMSASEEKIRQTILALLEATDKEGKKIFIEKAQWYAVYKVLSDGHGFPSKISEFCDIMLNWGMDKVNPACVYDSVRKVPNQISFPTPKVVLWHQYKDKAEAKFMKQIIVAIKLMELLER